MDLGSIDKRSRHITDVHRIRSELGNLDPEQTDTKLEEQKLLATTRWEACLKSFAHLFMMLNRGNGNKLPQDEFEITLAQETIDGKLRKTYARIWRNREERTYHVQPCTEYDGVGERFETESFGNSYKYHFGTHGSKSCSIQVDYDGAEPSIRLDRVNGYLVDDLSEQDKAIFLAAIEGVVLPKLDDTEETLAMLTNALLDDELNPELAKRARLPEH